MDQDVTPLLAWRERVHGHGAPNIHDGVTRWQATGLGIVVMLIPTWQKYV